MRLVPVPAVRRILVPAVQARLARTKQSALLQPVRMPLARTRAARMLGFGKRSEQRLGWRERASVRQMIRAARRTPRRIASSHQPDARIPGIAVGRTLVAREPTQPQSEPPPQLPPKPVSARRTADRTDHHPPSAPHTYHTASPAPLSLARGQFAFNVPPATTLSISLLRVSRQYSFSVRNAKQGGFACYVRIVNVRILSATFADSSHR